MAILVKVLSFAALCVGGAAVSPPSSACVAGPDSASAESCSVQHFQKESALLQLSRAKLASRSSGSALSPRSPCGESCPCWSSLAEGITCGDRIGFVAGPQGQHTGDAAAAAVFVQQEYPEICSCDDPNTYEKVEGVGGWGGWCTCPDGQQYNVGDRHDGCAKGSASLACEGGVPGKCMKEVNASRKGMQVTCARPKSNVYEQADDVGAWGGWCTCPDGESYNVGDRHDGCARGRKSLACIGGTPGKCEKTSNSSRKGMRAICGGPPKQNVYKKVGSAGGWGGWCTCPDGQRYSVGDQHDGCGSLACVGGTSGECEKTFDATREGMTAFCAAAETSSVVATTAAPTQAPTPAPTPRPQPNWNYVPNEPVWNYRPSQPVWNYRPSEPVWTAGKEPTPS